MSVTFHSSTIVTSANEHAIQEARQKAIDIYDKSYEGAGKLVSEVTKGLMAGYRTFFIAPHGSNEGWDIQEQCSKAQELFIEWMTEHGDYLDFETVVFGQDLYR